MFTLATACVLPCTIVVIITTVGHAMEKAISAADANRKFSKLLQSVREGHSYIVTSHGKPLAKIVPVGHRDPLQVSSRSALLARLRSQPVVKASRWTRDELYEDAE